MSLADGRKDNTYSHKLNGYRCSHRNKWLFISYGLLMVQELSLLEFYADVFDFDKKHRNFGLFKVDFEAIADVFNCSSNTIRNWHNKLLKIGFIEKGKGGFYKLACSNRFIPEGKWEGKAAHYSQQEKDQSIGIIFQNFGMDLQSIERKLQPVVKNDVQKLKKTPSIGIGSFKVDSKDYQEKKVLIKQEVRSDREYWEIWDKGDYKRLMVDDMKWIDKNIIENLTTN